jgi:hypothetical protein
MDWRRIAGLAETGNFFGIIAEKEKETGILLPPGATDIPERSISGQKVQPEFLIPFLENTGKLRKMAIGGLRKMNRFS